MSTLPILMTFLSSNNRARLGTHWAPLSLWKIHLVGFSKKDRVYSYYYVTLVIKSEINSKLGMMLSATFLPRSTYISLLYTITLQVVNYVGSKWVMDEMGGVAKEEILLGMVAKLELLDGAVI